MTQRISITVDADLVRPTIQTRTYRNRDGEDVTVREFKLDIVEKKTPDHIKSFESSDMVKTHFVAITQTREERDAKAETVFVGDGIQFKKKNDAAPARRQPQAAQSEVDDMDRPF